MMSRYSPSLWRTELKKKEGRKGEWKKGKKEGKKEGRRETETQTEGI